MAYETTATIINDAAVELGLAVADVANPYTSTDANMVMLRRLLKSVGRSLAGERAWTQLLREHTFATVAGTDTYDLPTDFGSMIDQSGWNRTSQLPFGGPVSSQQWQCLVANGVTSTFNVMFRPLRRDLVLYPNGTATPGSLTIAFEYMSSWWVQPALPAAWSVNTAYTAGVYKYNGTNVYLCTTSGTSDVAPATGPSGTGTGITDGSVVWSYAYPYGYPGLDSPTAYTDTVWFDPMLAVRALKLAWTKAKGFDTRAVQADYDDAMSKASSDDSPSPILRLDRGMSGVRLIDAGNAPLTNYGS